MEFLYLRYIDRIKTLVETHPRFKELKVIEYEPHLDRFVAGIIIGHSDVKDDRPNAIHLEIALSINKSFSLTREVVDIECRLVQSGEEPIKIFSKMIYKSEIKGNVYLYGLLERSVFVLRNLNKMYILEN